MSTIKAQRDAIRKFEAAHQAKGAQGSAIHELGVKLNERLGDQGWRKELGLELKTAISGSKEQLRELTRLLSNSQPSEGDRINAVKTWMADNRELIGWMSPKSRALLEQAVSTEGHAQRIDAEIAKAHAAIDAAFGEVAQTQPVQTALNGLASKASTEGALQRYYGKVVKESVGWLTKLLHVGTPRSIEQLSDTLSDPRATNAERKQALADWRQENPGLSNALDPERMANVFHNFVYAEDSDNAYANARQAVFDAFAQQGQT